MIRQNETASEQAHGYGGSLLRKEDLCRFIGALAVAAVGVSIALCIAALLFPITAPLSGSNLEILPSQQLQAQPEPREKGFLALAAVLGFLGALAGAVRSPMRQVPRLWHWLLLASLVPGLNLWIGLVMTHPAGIFYAALALLHSLAVVVLFARWHSGQGAGTDAA